MRNTLASFSFLFMVAGLASSCSSTTIDPPKPTDNDASVTPTPPSGPPAWIGLSGERRPALPKQIPAITATFTTSDACAACHTAGEGTPVMRDDKGRDISPLTTWRPSMMAMAARDPFYLAVVDEERSSRPGAEALIDGACIRCHAPAAVVERGAGGGTVTLPDLFASPDKEVHAGREGVTCTLCHQLTRDARGPDATFGGAFTVGEAREIYGPHREPVVNPMRTFVSYTPMYSDHMASSELCASCHTVFTRAYDVQGKATGPKLPEQVTFLEWRNSIYSASGDKGASCQSCHIPTGDQDGAPITAILAKVPATGLTARKPLGRHSFLGGNVTMLRAFADDGGWSGSFAEPKAFGEQAEATRKNLEGAASLSVSARRTDQGVEVDVRVENKTGHKFPTGYPSRRAFLHVKVSGVSGVVFESGRSDSFGRIVDRGGHVLDAAGKLAAHRDVISLETDTQIYEAVLGNEQGKVVSRPLEATRYLKDNRLLPLGYSKSHPDAALTTSYGPERDADFGSSDVVHYSVATPAKSPLTVEVELLFQSLRPAELDTLAERPTQTARKLFDLVANKLEPVIVAKATAPIP